MPPAYQTSRSTRGTLMPGGLGTQMDPRRIVLLLEHLIPTIINRKCCTCIILLILFEFCDPRSHDITSIIYRISNQVYYSSSLFPCHDIDQRRVANLRMGPSITLGAGSLPYRSACSRRYGARASQTQCSLGSGTIAALDFVNLTLSHHTSRWRPVVVSFQVCFNFDIFGKIFE